MDFPLASPLPESVLARQARLPLKPDPVILSGKYVRLVPLDIARDVASLFRVSNGEAATLGDRCIESYDRGKTDLALYVGRAVRIARRSGGVAARPA